MAFGDDKATVGSLIGAGLGVLTRNAPLLLGIGVISAIINTIQLAAMQSHFAGAAILNLVFIVGGFVVHALLLRQVLSRENLVSANAPLRIGILLLVELAYVFAVGFGVVLLIVPGLMLAIRWVLASTFVLARGTGVSESLKASSMATDGHRWAVFGACIVLGLVIGLPQLVLVQAGGGIAALNTILWASGLGVFRAVLTIFTTAFSAAVSVGFFAELGGRADQYEDVFA